MRLSAEVDANGIVTSAQSAGTLFRGFERMLQGKDPRDAVVHVARICGVCPISQSMSAVNALDELYHVAESVPQNALAVRNFIQAANFIASHATHIYVLFGPDLANPRYRDVLTGPALNLGATGNAVWREMLGRFAPLGYRMDGQNIPIGTSYLGALPARKKLQEAIAHFGGRMPHPISIVPGGVTCTPNIGEITKATTLYLEAMRFVQDTVLGVPLNTWVENTAQASSPQAAVNFVTEHLAGLINRSSDNNFSAANGWKDVEFFAAFGSELVGEKILGLPASLRLDKLGGYSDPSKMCFLSYGAFYDSTKDGYTPTSPTGERFLTSGVVRANNLRFEDLDAAKITESIECAFYEDNVPSRHPYDGTTVPISDVNKINFEAGPADQYSWCKAPRYDGIAAEVGPLARLIVAQDPLIMGLSQAFVQAGMSPANVYTRMLARMHETAIVAHKITDFLEDIDPGRRFAVPLDMRAGRDSKGQGLWEAPRGALGHWITSNRSGRTQNYQAIVPSTWNLGPRDENGIPCPVEQALVGNAISGVDNVGGADFTNPVAILHVGRSYDPCLACAVHTIDATGKNAPRDYELF